MVPDPVPSHPRDDDVESTLEPTREQAHEEPGLAQRVVALEARERELVDRLARLQADFDNFRRRVREDVALSSGRGKESLLKALLPVLDNLDRAFAHTDDAGLKAIARQLTETLPAHGIIVLDPQGEAFDAKLHEAVAQEAREDAKPGSVVAVLSKGYQIDGRVVRPARVVVAP